jgi:hypothetical protein
MNIGLTGASGVEPFAHGVWQLGGVSTQNSA